MPAAAAFPPMKDELCPTTGTQPSEKTDIVFFSEESQTFSRYWLPLLGG
jgi:hypothetical protein